jgi:hypothetical protein
MKFWRRSKPFAKSRKKSGNYAWCATAARFIAIIRFMTIAFTATFAAPRRERCLPLQFGEVHWNFGSYESCA